MQVIFKFYKIFHEACEVSTHIDKEYEQPKICYAQKLLISRTLCCNVWSLIYSTCLSLTSETIEIKCWKLGNNNANWNHYYFQELALLEHFCLKVGSCVWLLVESAHK